MSTFAAACFTFSTALLGLTPPVFKKNDESVKEKKGDDDVEENEPQTGMIGPAS